MSRITNAGANEGGRPRDDYGVLHVARHRRTWVLTFAVNVTVDRRRIHARLHAGVVRDEAAREFRRGLRGARLQRRDVSSVGGDGTVDELWEDETELRRKGVQHGMRVGLKILSAGFERPRPLPHPSSTTP